MDEDEDEDVDLEHTVLYKYMHEQGLVERTQPEDVKEEGNGATEAKDTFMKVPTALLNYLHSELLQNSGLTTLVGHYLDKHKKVIINSRALAEDDANFLENLLDPFAQPSYTSSTSNHLWLNLKIVIAPVMLLIAYSSVKLRIGFSVFNYTTTVAEGIFISALSGYVILKLSKQLIIWRKKKIMEKSLTQVTELVDEGERFLKSARKCLNYIQELEVVGRGLILTTAGTSISKMEQSMLFPHLQSLPSGCLCTILRNCLFTCLRQRFNDTKIATIQLIDSYRLRKEIDNGHYVAYMTDQELEILPTSDLSKQELSNSTECLSVSSIKEMGQLFDMQFSEFLRRLALCFYSELVLESDSLHIDKCFTVIPPTINSLSSKMRSDSKVLNEHFKFHQKLTRERKNTPQKESTSVIQSVMSSQRALLTAINSLSLHLQVSLARIDDLTDVLQNADDICKCTEAAHANEHRFNPDVYQNLNDQLQLIKQDLDACNLCWDESALRLQKLGPNREGCGDLQIPVTLPDENNADRQSGIPLLEKTDIAPEDQIFEAYVDENQVPNDDDDCYWDLELRKKTAEERNISKRMFSELKTVLVPKVQEWQKREAKALRTGDIIGNSSTSLTSNEHLPDETLNQTAENSLPIMEQNIEELVDRTKPQQQIEHMPSFSRFNSDIASMIAARSRLLKPAPCETFDSVGDEYCDSDTSSDA